MAPRDRPARRVDPPADVDPVQRLLAYEEIRQLAARYAVAVALRDVDALVDLYVPDVRTRAGEIGHEALRRQFATHLRAHPYSILITGGHVIDLEDADHASGIVTCYAELGGDDEWIRQAIAYHDTYERRDGRWYFRFRDHQLYYGLEVPERPMSQPDAEWPARAVGRGTVPVAWATWQDYWNQPC